MRALRPDASGAARTIAWIVLGALAACTPRPAPPPPPPTAQPAVAPGTHRRAKGVQEGLASWYGGKHHGGPTASGERFDKRALTAAHRTLKMGTRVRVTRKKNGRSVIVRINDRGPYGKAIIDLSEAAARKLDMIDDGIAKVRVEVLK